MSYEDNSLTDFLFAFLFSARSSRLFHEIVREREISRYEKNNVSVALSRMRKKGYARSSPSGWVLTEKGCRQAANRDGFEYISSPFKPRTVHNSIIAFDIPERERKVRNWLRNQLKIFDYIMLQQSLWKGPGPLPKEFTRRLNDFGITKNVKIFKITTPTKK